MVLHKAPQSCIILPLRCKIQAENPVNNLESFAMTYLLDSNVSIG